MDSIVSVLEYIVFGLCILTLIVAVILIMSDRKGSKLKGKGTSISKTNIKKLDKPSKKINVIDSVDILDFDDIQIFSPENPIGVIVRNNKTQYVGVVEVSGINYNLLSAEERIILEESFGSFLNGIDYPIQIYVQSRKLDIENYNNNYTARLNELKKTIDNLKEKIDYLSEHEALESEINENRIKYNRIVSQYNYGQQVKQYIIDKSRSKYMFDRKYYIVFSYTYNSSAFSEPLTYDEILSNAFYYLSNKANNIISSLSIAKLKAKMLSGAELLELLYVSYNKDDSQIYKMKNALKSKFSHLYTTSEPVEIKAIKRKIETLKKEEEKLLLKKEAQSANE